MDFYSELTQLLKLSNELRELENKKKINYSEKEENMKNFIKRLKTFLNWKIIGEENRIFRKYFIEYLNDLISQSMSFCSQNEKNEIQKLIKSICNNNNNNENNINNFINNDKNLENYDIKNKKSENYELLDNYENINNNLNKDDKNIIILNIDKNEKGFYPKNYKNNNVNNIQNFENNEKILNKKNNDIPINLNQNQNQINQNSDFNEDNKDKNEDEKEENEEENEEYEDENIDEKEDKKEDKNEDEKENENGDKNEDIFSDIKSNIVFIPKQNNIISNDNINYEDNQRKDDINYKNRIQNNNLFNLNINNNIHNNNIINDNINNNNINKLVSDEYNNNNKSNSKNNINDNKKNNNINNKHKEDKNLDNIKKQKKIYNKKDKKKIIPNPAFKYQEEIDKYYNEIFKDNITQNFIKLITQKKDNNFNTRYTKLFQIVENNREEYIDKLYKEKITTLICLLYYFAKKNRAKINKYIFKPDEVDENLYNFLQKNILNKDNTEILEFDSKKIKKFQKDFCKDLYLDSSKGKDLIFSAYSFLIISRTLREYSNEKQRSFFEELLEKEYIISFKIQFILKHQEYYSAISKDFIEVYHGLHFINIFYSEIFNHNNPNNRIFRDDNIGKYKFGKDDFILSLDTNINFDINILFSEKDNKIYQEVFIKIGHFYSIDKFNSNDINDLIYYSTNKIGNTVSNFILNIVEHICQKMDFINNNYSKYIQNLKKIEKIIFNLGKDALNINKNNIIDKYNIDFEKKSVYTSLLNQIYSKIGIKYKGKFDFHLYPYGSVTQFLGGKNSDIDIYLDIRKLNNDNKISFLYNLKKVIQGIINKNVEVVISSRLYLLKFKYLYKEKETDFDVSLMGFCPYLHSFILRTYSLMDPRFPLLAITLKKFIELLKIKNQDNKPDYLNSFSWMILLITFLQDIIYPKILPKILSYKNNYSKNFKITYGPNSRLIFKCLELFIENIKEEDTLLPDSLFNKQKLIQIYQEQISKNEKNNLSCAELFLNFLEFIIFYFKSDSVYVNCSIENEAYESMYYILNNNNVENNKRDERFAEYFKYKYNKFINYNDNKKTKAKDGLILIRDPLDPHYNPAQTLKSSGYNTFMDNLKKGYLELLMNGNLMIQ